MFIFSLILMPCHAFSIIYCLEQYSLKNFVLKTDFDNTVITNSTLWTKSSKGSRIACAKECSLDKECVSIFYNKQSDVCTAHSVQFYSTEPIIIDVGSQYYTLPIDKEDCADILCDNPTSPDGVYTINPLDGKGPARVYCDMTTDGGGWTVFQRRQDGSIDFNRDWTDYKDGFGELSGEFWQGNDIISRLTTARESKLRVDMLDQDDLPGYATYSEFRVENETNNYRLTVTGYEGNVGDGLDIHSGLMFTTWDRDNDDFSQNCADIYPGAWWYGGCYSVNLNGRYNDSSYAKGINWTPWRGFSHSLKRNDMKLRPVQNCTVND